MMAMSSIAMRSILDNSNHEDDLANDLGALLHEQQGHDAGREEELNIYRSGSAPPTVQGSLSAVGGMLAGTTPVIRSHKGGGGGKSDFVTDDELRSDPSYISYYYSNVNLNPRLPPPLLSREEVRFAQRFQGRGGSGSVLGEIGDRGKTNIIGDDGGGRSSSVFSLQKEENGVESRKSDEWGGDGLIGLPGLGLGSRQKSLAEIIQDDLSLAKSVSRTASRNTFDDEVETSERQFALLHSQLGASMDVQTQGFGSLPAHSSYASALGSSLPRTTTPEPIATARTPSPHIPLIGTERNKNNNNIVPGDSTDAAAALSGLTLLTSEENCMASRYHHKPFNLDGQNLFDLNHMKRDAAGVNNPCVHSQQVKGSFVSMDGQLDLPNHAGMSSNLLSMGGCSPSYYHNTGVTNSSLSNNVLVGHGMNPSSPTGVFENANRNLPPLFENAAASAMAVSGMDPRAFGGSFGFRAGNHHAMDPSYFQYLQGGGAEPNVEKEYMASLYMDLAHNSHFATLNHDYYGNNDPYPCSPLGSHFVQNSPFGSNNNSPRSHYDRNLRFSSGMRTLMGPSWGLKSGSVCFDENFASSLLDEFKSNKTRCFELFEISGHVVDFSVDQYGSRFIQQKLENATTDERDMVFREIMPQGLSLMTDVFGNYVVQKFFDHGSASQLRELADLLTGHVLTLSLQMYGCRVIQKALEVVEVKQQIQMVGELDGHIMRCVRDQNGNHVIQKCIECVPESSIHFIISTFYDQILPLSTHPYGCRVIQRVLEHCSDPKTLDIVMTEILDSVCMLAQDQYGNYVIQHVLEHGKPEERSVIIKKLSGQIVQMSQQKFASNVVEKCLSFGDPMERLSLVNEMLGSSDENEPLQVMMKDQFANYVVQKVLETCDDGQLELIMNRIKVHLNALKKYTYGKHIVARVEKLVAAGEKRIGVLCLNLTP